MTIDDYLKRCKILRRRANGLQEKYKQLQDKATSPAAFQPGTPQNRQNANNNRENLYIKMIEAGEAAQLATLDYIEARQNLFGQLIQLPIDEATTLILYYIEELNVREICETWKPYNNGEPIARRTFYRYMNSGKDHLKVILAAQGIKT